MSTAPWSRWPALVLTGLPCISGGQAPSADLLAVEEVARAFAAVTTNYVDAVNDQTLVARCLQGMETMLAQEGKPLAAGETPAGSALEQVAQYVGRVREQYPEGIAFDRLSAACLKPMIEGLDRLSVYLGRAEWREMQVGVRGGFGAIGVELAREGEYIRIVSAIDGTPAARADLKPGDLIVAVDGTSTKGLALADAVPLLRGVVGSTVALTVERKGEAAPLRRDFVREVIRVSTARTHSLRDGIVHVRISQFQERTFEELVRALQKAHAEAGGLKGVVLDLRNNPGGLLTSCVDVAALFLPPDALVVELKGRSADSNQRLTAKRDGRGILARFEPWRAVEGLRNAPLVVVVNKQSAACSEIIAAAMQDHGRARVLGETTYGVGTIQTVLPLASGALKLTSARYHRPNGAAMDGNPVVPELRHDVGSDPAVFGGPDDPVAKPARDALLTR